MIAPGPPQDGPPDAHPGARRTRSLASLPEAGRHHRLSLQGRRGDLPTGQCSCGIAFRVSGSRREVRRRLRRAYRDHVAGFLDYALDLRTSCVTCRAGAGSPCQGLPAGRVHASRRIGRLLSGLPLARRRSS